MAERKKNQAEISTRAFPLESPSKNEVSEANLRWLKTVSSTKILMGCYSHSLSLAAIIMVSKNCPTIGEHVVVLFIT